MKICIVSDGHDPAKPFAAAVAEAQLAEAQAVSIVAN
jgi:predicted phosphodiesterase